MSRFLKVVSVIFAVSAAAVGLAKKSIAVKDDSGVKADLYVFGKNGRQKVAVVTNQKPKDAIKVIFK